MKNWIVIPYKNQLLIFGLNQVSPKLKDALIKLVEEKQIQDFETKEEAKLFIDQNTD